MSLSRGKLYDIIIDDKRYWDMWTTPHLTTTQLEDIVARIQSSTMCGIFIIPNKITDVYLYSTELVEGHIDVSKLEECEAKKFHIYIECHDSLLRVSRNVEYVFDKDEVISYIKGFGMSADEYKIPNLDVF